MEIFLSALASFLVEQCGQGALDQWVRYQARRSAGAAALPGAAPTSPPPVPERKSITEDVEGMLGDLNELRHSMREQEMPSAFMSLMTCIGILRILLAVLQMSVTAIIESDSQQMLLPLSEPDPASSVETLEPSSEFFPDDEQLEEDVPSEGD